MTIEEWQIQERLMRMGNEARYMKATSKALDIAELRKLAIKQLSREEYAYEPKQIKSYHRWIQYIKDCPTVVLFYIYVYRNNIPVIEAYTNKEILSIIDNYKFRSMNGTIPAFLG